MKRGALVYIFLITLGLSACGSPPPTVPPLPAGGPISECFPVRDAQVWEDANSNGLFDDGEKPLENIAVIMTPLKQSSRSFQGITDKDGKAKLRGIGNFGPKCDELEVAVSVPRTHSPTTPTKYSLVGLPYDEVLYFGMFSQFSTPTASVVSSPAAPTKTAILDTPVPDASSTTDFFIQLEKLKSGNEFFEACTLLTAEDFPSIFGGELEYPIINSGGIGETGQMTYDCMTDPSEAAFSMMYAISIEETARQAEAYFQGDLDLLASDAVLVDGLGDEAYYWVVDDAIHYVNVVQGNVYLKLNVGFWLEDTPENRDRTLEFARLILSRLLERGG